ncbi:MAG: hypothetical protein IPG67_14830 [Acidobacteria bacterium]|nr:hypothetical protein [Acidobacteriota bacterium]
MFVGKRLDSDSNKLRERSGGHPVRDCFACCYRARLPERQADPVSVFKVDAKISTASAGEFLANPIVDRRSKRRRQAKYLRKMPTSGAKVLESNASPNLPNETAVSDLDKWAPP